MKNTAAALIASLLAALIVFFGGCGAPAQATVESIQVEEAIETPQIEADQSAEDFDYTSVPMESVDSTCFSEIGYDEDHEILLVRFLESDSLYEYYDVPEDVYEDLLNADSPGGYYNDNIKGYYDYDQLE